MAREGLARRPLGLRDFVFMMREDQIDPAAVDIERLDVAALRDLRERHRRAFEMPPGPAAAERRIPGSPDGFVFGIGFLPEREVARVALCVLIARHPRADLDFSGIEARQSPVRGELRERKVDGAV